MAFWAGRDIGNRRSFGGPRYGSLVPHGLSRRPAFRVLPAEGGSVRRLGLQRGPPHEGREKGFRLMGRYRRLDARIRGGEPAGIGFAESQAPALGQRHRGRIDLRRRHGAGRRLHQRVPLQVGDGEPQFDRRAFRRSR
ncbi:MAG: hypothetical protein MZV64_53000 [Ignavibacteriales bacterium]|nr:hypothetical protein [Ignavibacteriales bacterium]